MTRFKFAPDFMCKNGQDSLLQNYIYFEERKTPSIAAIWGRFLEGISDKESSHVVVISSDSEVLRL